MQDEHSPLTFEQVPDAIYSMCQRLERIESFLKSNSNLEEHDRTDELLDINQAADFLHLKTSTLYSKVNRRELPVMKKSKKLYFSKKELIEYIKSGRKKTLREISSEADDYITKEGEL